MFDYHNYILPLCLAFGTRCVLLGVALWQMLKVQDLNYTIPGVIGSAVLASVFDMIPLFGHPLAAAVLLICVLKLTRSHLVDVRFTVGISYAVAFLLQMVILSLLPGNLQVHARTTDSKPESAMQEAASEDDETEADEKRSLSIKTNIVATNQTAVSATKAPVTPATTNPPPAMVPQPVIPVPAEDQALKDLIKSLRLKGVVHDARESSIMLGVGGKTFTIRQGESINLKTPAGPVDIKVEQVSSIAAILNVGGKLTPVVLP